MCLGESSCVTKDGLSGQTIFRILYIGIALMCIGESFSIFFFVRSVLVLKSFVISNLTKQVLPNRDFHQK